MESLCCGPSREISFLAVLLCIDSSYNLRPLAMKKVVFVAVATSVSSLFSSPKCPFSHGHA